MVGMTEPGAPGTDGPAGDADRHCGRAVMTVAAARAGLASSHLSQLHPVRLGGVAADRAEPEAGDFHASLLFVGPDGRQELSRG